MAFWVDETVEEIIKKNDKGSYLVTDWMTASGHAHIGSLRGAIVHDLVRQGISEKQKQAEFQWGYDDFDPMDGLPSYLDKSFVQYMGLPLNKVPAPDGESESFAAQYAKEFQKILDELNIKVKVVYNSELYKKGEYNEAIKIVLDHAKEIRQIYKEVSGSDKGDDWFPFQVICPKCGKIGTTKVIGWDGEKVKFRCEENLVEWAKGCGAEGEVSPFDGNGKMPWKVEWPSKWFITKTDIEGEGKDHFASGGSRDVAERIYKEIFKLTSPFDIRYEHFTIGGAKMSSSKGLGVTAKAMADFLPANILKFLFVRTKAKRSIEFNPEGDSIPLLYDEYDRCAKAYDEDRQLDLARAFYYTQIDIKANLPQYYLRFSKIAAFLQMPRMDILKYAAEEKGEELSSEEKTEIENRIQVAKKWLENYAPESAKFMVQENMPDVKLSDEQKKFLAKIADTISQKDKWTGEDLHQKIHEIKNEMGIPPRDAFSAIYLSFLGKDSGPQAGWLLASLQQKFVIKRLKEV